MKQLLSIIGSMKTMAILMLIFAIASGYATFIENDFGTITAKAEVYNAFWFEVLLTVLTINLIYNIIRFKMIQKKKTLVLLFHVSFIVILIGAAVTRYVGYEGSMHIREGETEDRIISTENYLSLDFEKAGMKSHYEKSLYLSKLSSPSLDKTVNTGSDKVEVSLLEYIPNAVYKLVEDPSGKPVANLMVTGVKGPEQIQMGEGDHYEAPEYIVDFASGKTFDKPVVKLFIEEGQLYLDHGMEMTYVKMDDQSTGKLPVNAKEPFVTRTLFSVGSSSIVLREFYASAVKKLAPEDSVNMKMNNAPDALRVALSIGDESTETIVFGSAGRVGKPYTVKLGDMTITVSYGAKMITLPFSLKLIDFELERYPGSMSPASYASDVILLDKEHGVEQPFRIFMNNVLDHRNFRFFQSSYDQDELGTILSVNHDPGTLPTYIGYLMLTIGIFGIFFTSNGRFRKLMNVAEKAAKAKEALASIALAVMVTMMPSLHAEEVNPIIKTVMGFDKAHAENFGHLVIQDAQGRMKPMNTLSMEILHKINRSGSILGLTTDQVVMGMMMRPDAWREIKMIKTSHKEVNKLVGIDEKEKIASFSQFFEYPEEISGYKLAQYVEEATRKAPGKRDKFDKALLKVDERVNVAYMVYTGSLMRMWPKDGDPNNTWYDTIGALKTFPSYEGAVIQQMALTYFTAVDEGLESGDWTKADASLKLIDAYQREYGSGVYVDETKIKAELWYNESNIFERLWPLYFVVGFILLILSFVKIVKPSFKLTFFSRTTFWLLVLFLLIHTFGLGLRWYISGHAPWSNGYESMVYIAWASVLAGFIFSKNSPITLAATGILSGLILFVAHLNWMDPQVTNLVPVLQSYWLSIHVSMITASYGFLGLGALLGFITLLLFIMKNEKNDKQISLSIKELNAINEMGLMIGLAMLTVGNFLGGVWANESWGRYWGWDPKETWALVTILVYAVVIHLRFIKAIYTPYMYSVISLLSFTTVLMTYFGVNYYLAGMHSYAKGDPVPVPDFVPLTYTIIFIIIALAWRKRKLSA